MEWKSLEAIAIPEQIFKWVFISEFSQTRQQETFFTKKRAGELQLNFFTLLYHSPLGERYSRECNTDSPWLFLQSFLSAGIINWLSSYSTGSASFKQLQYLILSPFYCTRLPFCPRNALLKALLLYHLAVSRTASQLQYPVAVQLSPITVSPRCPPSNRRFGRLPVSPASNSRTSNHSVGCSNWHRRYGRDTVGIW